jgi:sulfite exporter TauE/SafE
LQRRADRPVALRRSRSATPTWLVPLPARGLGLGMVTAVLPCGALVAAWVIAAATAHALTGATAMLAFSVASAPGTLAALLGRHAIAAHLHKLPRAALASAWFITALLVLGRMWLATQTQCH